MLAKGQRSDFTDAPPFEVINDHEGIVSDWSNPGPVRDASGPNSSFRQLCWFFYLKKIGPWMFLEPDAIPLVPEWADRIDDEYKRAGKLFMGSRVPGKPGEYDDHSTGNMVLPQDAAVLSQNLMLPRHANIGGKSVEIAFDVAGAVDVLANYHDTPLLHHVFRGPEFVTMADLQRIRPGAVLFHTDKTGGLIRLLREQRFGARHGAPRDAATGSGENAVRVVETAAPAISETPRTKVFTYYAPVQSEEGRAEQDRILTMWTHSWEAHGFEPVLLTPSDAARFPDSSVALSLHQKPTVNPPWYEAACWNRWLGMVVVGGGMLVDYDTLCFSTTRYESIPDEKFPLVLGDGVPCAVVGTALQYANAIRAFLTCPPGEEKGRPHLSDMIAARMLGFKSLAVCKEYKAPGWETADMVHCSHAACDSEKRSEVMERAARERMEAQAFSGPAVIDLVHESNGNGSAPESIASLIRDGVGILSQLATGASRKKRILGELRKAGLVAQAKKRSPRRMETAALK